MPCIVVLEDEPDIGAFLCDALEGEGYGVVCVRHPAQLAGQLLDIEPDLFLMDIMLPGSSGIDVARSLREERFAETPMVALSASVLRAQMAKHSGLFDETIRKPFDLDELFAVIERCLAAAGTSAARLQADLEGGVAKPADTRLAFGELR